MKLNRMIIISFTLILVICIFFTWKYIVLLNHVNEGDVYKYNVWRNSVKMTHYFLTKDIKEENDTIVAVQMYYRATGYSDGIVNDTYREALTKIEHEYLDFYMERFLVHDPEPQYIQKAIENLEMVLNRLPERVKKLSELDKHLEGLDY